MLKLGEKFAFDLTWHQEFGHKSIIESIQVWLDGLIQAISDKNKGKEEFFKKKILSVAEELESKRAIR